MIWLRIILATVIAALKAWFSKNGRREKLESDLEKLDEKIKAKENEIHACEDAGSGGYLVLCEQLGVLEAKRSRIQARLDKMPTT